jgi:hypothetical protein
VLQSLISRDKVELLLAFILLLLLLVKHDLLAEVLEELRILLGLLHLLGLLFLAILINLIDYRCKELLLVGLARVKLDTFGESFASASLNEGREERVRSMVVLRGRRIAI